MYLSIGLEMCSAVRIIMTERRDIFEIMTSDEISKLKQTHNCPICGFEFVGYPTGWTWENHIRDCLEGQGRT
jgi:hypothetical protein